MDYSKKRNVVIVGAGPAGLTLGYQLLKHQKNFDVTIIEKNDYVGGISASANSYKNTIDFGPHRYHAKYKDVDRFWKEIMSVQSEPSADDVILNREVNLDKNGKDPNKSDDVLLYRKRLSRIFFNGKFYDYPISLKLETFTNMGFSNSLNVLFSYLKSCVFKKPETNLENFFINRFGQKLYQMFFEYYTQNLWGRHPKNISAEWGAERVKGVSIHKAFKNALQKTLKINNKKTEVSLIENFYYPKLGCGQLWDVLAENIVKLGGKIILKTKINKIYLDDNRVKKISVSNNKLNIIDNIDFFVSSMAIDELFGKLENTPTQMLKIAKGLPFRNHILVHLVVDKLLIKNNTLESTIKNQVPDVWIYVQDRNVKLGRFVIYNNFSPYIVDEFQNNLSVGLEYFVDTNDDLWKNNDNDIIEYAINEFKKINVINDTTKIKIKKVFRTEKAYPAYFDTYNQINQLWDYLYQIDNLYCIGRNGQHKYNNMDDSVLSGLNTAQNILLK